MKPKKIMALFLVALMVSLLTACGVQQTASVSDQPVTLKVYNWGMLTDDLFQKVFVAPVKAKYPNISLEMVTRGTGMNPQDLVAAEKQVDIVFAWNDVLPQFTNLEMLYDITPLLKKQNVDLNRFDPLAVDSVRDGNDRNKLYGLPFAENFYALFYNKDIFDKFGVAYPKDGMTWDDAIALAQKLTKQDGGTQYKGLDPEGIEKLGNSLSLQFVDPKTGQASVNTDQWKKVLELAQSIYSIPGNDNPMVTNASTIDRFIKNRNEAMLASTGEVLNGLANADFNWDIAQYPSFSERPNTYGMVKASALCITANSNYKEQAMQVLQVLTSDSVQSMYSRMAGGVSPLKNAELQKNFGADLPLLQGKHVEGIFKSKPAPFAAQSIYSGNVRSVLEKKFQDYKTGKDVNTILLEAQDEANKQIASMGK